MSHRETMVFYWTANPGGILWQYPKYSPDTLVSNLVLQGLLELDWVLGVLQVGRTIEFSIRNGKRRLDQRMSALLCTDYNCKKDPQVIQGGWTSSSPFLRSSTRRLCTYQETLLRERNDSNYIVQGDTNHRGLGIWIRYFRDELLIQEEVVTVDLN